MKKSFALIGVAAAAFLGIVGYAYVHASSIALLNPQGIIALQERWVLVVSVLVCGAIVLPVFIMLFFFAWKYRATSDDAPMHHEPNWDHDTPLAEFIWWVIPGVIILFLGVIAWQSSHALDPYKPIKGLNPAITVDVVALDWKWLFIYPAQHIATVSILEIPVNTPVHFYLTADAPMNSFWIPSLGGQIMAMPGMSTQLNLEASKIGTFNGSSANISGDGFAGMTFPVKSVSAADFSAWVSSVQNMNNPLTQATYASLAKPSEYVPPMYYSFVDPELYTDTVMKYMVMSSGSMQMTGTTSATSSMQMQGMNGMQMPGM